MMASLYVHLPFCVKKCAYCDFESYAGRLSRADEYIDELTKEAKARKREYGDIALKTAYFGGGTPSLLSKEQLKRLCGELLTLFPPEKDAEITLEANPGTVSEGYFREAARAGVNRVSLGVQAYQEGLLKALGRIHTSEQAKIAVQMAQCEGIYNVSCDIMSALPGQSAEDLIETIDFVCDLNVRHVSCYSLILEEGTPLWERVKRGETTLPSEDKEIELQRAAIKRLKQRSFRRYEISNYALEGFESRHNMVYWTGGDYLGLGCAAHSYMRGERFCNPDFESYMRGVSGISREIIDKSGRLEERIMLETRLTRGLDLTALKSEHGEEIYERLLLAAGKFRNYMSVNGGFLRFNKEGLLLHNALVLELVSAVG